MTAKTKQKQFNCLNRAKNITTSKNFTRHVARRGVERQPSHSQIFRNLNVFRQNCTLFSYPVFEKD